jgi:hypothetical protein
MDITIKLSDVNDNSPVFSPVQGPIPISEGAALNTLVYRVYASDADFGKLHYSRNKMNPLNRMMKKILLRRIVLVGFGRMN